MPPWRAALPPANEVKGPKTSGQESQLLSHDADLQADPQNGLPDTRYGRPHILAKLLVSPAPCCMLLQPPLKRPVPQKGCRSNTPSQPQAVKPATWYLTTQYPPAPHTERKGSERDPLRGLVTINLVFAMGIASQHATRRQQHLGGRGAGCHKVVNCMHTTCTAQGVSCTTKTVNNVVYVLDATSM